MEVEAEEELWDLAEGEAEGELWNLAEAEEEAEAGVELWNWVEEAGVAEP